MTKLPSLEGTDTRGAVLLAVEDLRFFSRLREACAALEWEAEHVASPTNIEKSEPRALLCVVDLRQPEPVWRPSIEAAVGLGLPVVAFGPHVHKDALDHARRLGAAVYSNGALFQGAESILREHALRRV